MPGDDIVRIMAERPISSEGSESLISGSEQRDPIESFPQPSDVDRDLDDNHFIRVAAQESVLGQQVRHDDDHQASIERQG